MNDIFALAGLEKPNIGLLSDEFLEDVRKTPLKNLAVELLERLLKDEITLEQPRRTSCRRRNTATACSRRCGSITTGHRDGPGDRGADRDGEGLPGGAEAERGAGPESRRDRLLRCPGGKARSAAEQMGDETLKKLAVELTEKLRASTTVDWQVRDSVRASMRLMIRRLLRKYKYPPEGQEEAIAHGAQAGRGAGGLLDRRFK